VQQQIDETKKQISRLHNSRDSINDEITSTSNDLAVATARIQELKAIIHEISTNDHKYELYNWYCKAMHRNGIPMTVLRKYIPVINYELNHILSPIVGFGVYFKVEDDSDNIEIVMRYDNINDDTRPITMASGMEKFITNMAIRHVILKISALNKPTLRIIDEGFDVLDNDNVYIVQKFFENVKVDFDNIVIITHIDALKDCADHVVTVSQKAGVSRLCLN
jgi:DNA repair exonuclease SbcCD ATPase subunit